MHSFLGMCILNHFNRATPSHPAPFHLHGDAMGAMKLPDLKTTREALRGTSHVAVPAREIRYCNVYTYVYI